MGEYIDYKGQNTKLGTCEDLYYARLDQLKAAGVDQYINPDYGFRYRFPFPEEDNLDIGEFDKFNKSHVIKLAFADYALVDIDHRTISHACNANGSYNVNVMIPCPQSKEFAWTFTQMPDNTVKRLRHSPLDWRIVGICQQKQVDGEVWTVIECPYCGAKVRICRDEAEKLCHSIQENYIDRYTGDEHESQRQYYSKIVSRIMGGYKNCFVVKQLLVHYCR